MVGAHKLKCVCRLVAFQALFVIIVPYRTFHVLIDRNETIVAIKHDTDNRCGMVLKKLPKLMYFDLIIEGFAGDFYKILLLERERRFIAVLDLRKNGEVYGVVCLGVLYSVQIHVILEKLPFLEP